MSVEHSDVIDVMAISPDGKSAVLVIADHMPWGDDAHLFRLQEKINSYLAFIESGEIFDVNPAMLGLDMKLSVFCKYHPDSAGLYFLGKAKTIVEAAGFSFHFEVPDNSADADLGETTAHKLAKGKWWKIF